MMSDVVLSMLSSLPGFRIRFLGSDISPVEIDDASEIDDGTMIELLDVEGAHPVWSDGCGRLGQSDRFLCEGWRFRSRLSARDLADAGRVGWKCRMRPAGMKRPLALFTAFPKVFSACSKVSVSPASARYSLQASAYRSQSAFY